MTEEQTIIASTEEIQSSDSTDETAVLAEEFIVEQDNVSSLEPASFETDAALFKTPREIAISIIIRVLALAGIVILALLSAGWKITH